MEPRLCILSCDGFRPEIDACIQAQGWNDVECATYPGLCGRPPLSWAQIASLLPVGCTQAVVLGRSCLSGLASAPPEMPPVRLLVQDQCFDLVADHGVVAQAVADGAYLVSPGWLRDWEAHLGWQGFTPQAAGEFFRGFAREIVLLDSATDARSGAHLTAMAQATGLPGRRVAVGLDHVQWVLARVVHDWRLAQARAEAEEQARAHGRVLADHVLAMDLLGRLTRPMQESEVVAQIEGAFRMLFAPKVWHYRRFEHGEAVAPTELDPEYERLLRAVDQPYGLTRSGSGFALRIGRQDQLAGMALVDGLAFPQYLDRYLGLALALTDVCALAVQNARTRRRLGEAEKMASLGVLVAGVAHEISTPVSVGLIAASTLQRQTQQLATRFAERSLTQAEFEGHLTSALAGAELIHNNLERVGKLVDAFRQVAVGARRQPPVPVVLRTVLDATASALRERLASAQVTLDIDCPATLHKMCQPGQWESIFSNLIVNSLQHGFAGRDHGRIRIHATGSPAGITVDYADDGVGLTEAVRLHIFDPFFTTDMQHGMGLGMHLVYNLVVQGMGGSIVADAASSQGARFLIRVPGDPVEAAQ